MPTDSTSGKDQPQNTGDELDPGTPVRQELRRGSAAAKEAFRAGAGAVRGSGRLLGRRSKETVESGRETVDRSYRTVTLQAYRDEVDEALGQIVDVLAAQDAEVRHLQGRVEELEAQQSQNGNPQ